LGALERLAERLQVPLAELLREDDAMPIPPLPSLERAEGSPERAEIDGRLREGLILCRQNRAGEAIETLMRIRNRNLLPNEQILLHWYLGRCHIQLGRGDEARKELLEGIAIAERHGDVEHRSWLYVELGIAYSAMRKHQLALEQFQIGQDAVEKGTIRDPLFHLQVLFHIGDEYRHLGESGPAMEALSQAAILAGDVQNPEQLGSVYAALAAGYSSAGDMKRARTYAIRSAQAYEEASTQQLVTQVYTRLGTVYASAGQTEDALVHLSTAQQMSERRNDLRGATESQRGLALIYLQQNQLDAATHAAKEALRLATSLGDPVLEGEALLAQAQVFSTQNDRQGAERTFERAIELLTEADAVQPLSDAFKQYSDYLEAHGEGTRALSLLKQAWQLRERAGAAL
jgi:tetratricopeptide (TPR) repeat protein